MASCDALPTLTPSRAGDGTPVRASSRSAPLTDATPSTRQTLVFDDNGIAVELYGQDDSTLRSL